MRITGLEWFKVHQFVHPELVHSPEYRDEEEAWDQPPKMLVRLLSDESLVGLGETTRNPPEEQMEAAARSLIGVDPLGLNLRALPFEEYQYSIRRGLEVAILDLVGKARNMRVCELMGGAFREVVVSSYWAGRQAPDYSARTAQTARELGYTSLKLKAKQGDPLVERIRAMHEVAPDLRFIIDPMQRYDDVEEMIRISQELESCNVLCLEDPLPKERVDWYQRLRQEGPVPLALHVRSPAELLAAIKAEQVDIFNCSPLSVMEFVPMVDMAEAAGIPCWHGSGGDLGILDLAYTHACAAARTCTLPSGIHSAWLHLDDFLLNTPERRGERIPLPPGPGLGGELDMDAVENYLIARGQVPG